MDVRNGRIKKLTDEVLREVAGGLETKLPLKTRLITDDKIKKEEENLKNENVHEIN